MAGGAAVVGLLIALRRAPASISGPKTDDDKVSTEDGDSVSPTTAISVGPQSAYRLLSKLDVHKIPDVGKIPQLLAIIAASAYVLGLLELNAYLLRYGVSDFNLLRPRYVAIGGLSLIVIVACTVTPCIAWWQITDAFVKRTPLAGMVPITIMSLGLVIIPAVLLNAFLNLSFGSAFWVEIMGLVLGFSLLFAVLPWVSIDGSVFHVPEVPYSVPRWVGSSLGALLFLLTFALFIAIMASRLLPVVPEQIGGLKSRPVSIVVRSADIAALRASGMALSSNGVSTGQVRLVYDSSDFMLIQVRGDKSIRLDSTEIIASSIR